MARRPRGAFLSLSLLRACLNNALRGGWTVGAPSVDFIDSVYDADPVGAEDGADSRWEGGVGDWGWCVFAEGVSEEDGTGYVFEGLTDDVLLRDRNSLYEGHDEFESCFRGWYGISDADFSLLSRALWCGDLQLSILVRIPYGTVRVVLPNWSCCRTLMKTPVAGNFAAPGILAPAGNLTAAEARAARRELKMTMNFIFTWFWEQEWSWSGRKVVRDWLSFSSKKMLKELQVMRR